MLLKIQKWMDKLTTFVSALMCAAMMLVLFINVILRYIPGIGGFSWYMEGSQYLNVWSMLLVGIAITVRNEHLRVNVIEDLCNKNPKLHKIQKTFVSFCIALFYGLATWSGQMLVKRGIQRISTMPQYKMSAVYWMIPVCCAICCVAAIIDLLIELKKKPGEGEGK